MAKFIRINDEVVNKESIDYITKKQGQKSQEDKTPIYIMGVVLKSGVQINIPFEEENACNYIHNAVTGILGAENLKIPTIKIEK